MTKYHKYILLGIICFLASSCVCTTYYSNSADSQLIEAFDYTLNCQVREDPMAKTDNLLIVFDYCTYEGTLIKCTNKKLLKESLKISASFPKTDELILQDKYASHFTYSSPDFNRLWKENNYLSVHVTFDVDSLGVILKKSDYYKLKKDSECMTHFALH
jgi:hypothetical protein